MTELKSRNYEYAQTSFDAESARRMSGLEYMQSLAAGDKSRQPSMIVTMGLSEPFNLEYGKSAIEAEPSDFLLNPMGALHGGFVATLLDTVLGVSVHTTLEPGIGFTTVELKVNYTRVILPSTGRIRAEASIVHRGRQIATAEARVFGLADGKLYAHGSTTCLIFPLRPAKEK